MSFIHDHFLLETPEAETLYHEYAKDLPLIDYHNHLPPQEVAQNRKFKNISEAWLHGDHYKWRAMRTLGIDEKFITGDASDKDKFLKWAETIPYILRNPLFHWTQLELKRYFDVEAWLNPQTAEEIYAHTGQLLAQDDFSTLGLLQKMNVEVICTTDDPIDSLEHHQAFANAGKELKMLPAFRPDKAMAVNDPMAYQQYLDKLAEVSQVSIQSFDTFLEAIQARHDYFHTQGCRLSDHGLNQINFVAFTAQEIEAIFQKLLQTQALDSVEITKFHSACLLEFARMDHRKAWVQQFHLGALRNNNARMLRELGPDTGFDSIGDFPQAQGLANFFNALDDTDQLTKTIIYNLNPSQNEVFATMIGNYSGGGIRGKMQFGSGWWFLDQLDGMEKQMNALSNMGLLSCFVGMLTDSRSFLSFPRHEYFRRLLCNIFGNDIQKGLLPNDTKWIGGIVKDICYFNAKNYFNF